MEFTRDSKYVKEMDRKGFGGSNEAINNRLQNSFNQFTRTNNDMCSVINQERQFRKPIKYYTNKVWAPAPTSNRDLIYFTPVGNQRSYFVKNNLNFPINGSPTTLGNRRFIQYVTPLATSPLLSNNAINTADIDVNSNFIRYGEVTNKNDLTKDVLSSTDYNRWEFVDPNIVQNVDNIIFAKGVIPRGGISSRNELRNYSTLMNC